MHFLQIRPKPLALSPLQNGPCLGKGTDLSLGDGHIHHLESISRAILRRRDARVRRKHLGVAHPAIVRSHSHVVVAHLPIATHLFSFGEIVRAHIRGCLERVGLNRSHHAGRLNKEIQRELSIQQLCQRRSPDQDHHDQQDHRNHSRPRTQPWWHSQARPRREHGQHASTPIC